MENIFFDKHDLKYCGNNVIIGKTVRIRRPQDCIIGDNVIIDDFAYISCGIEIGPYVHISSNCSFIGGTGKVIMGAFSGLSTGCRVITASSNYLADEIDLPTLPHEYCDPSICEPVVLEEFALVGANCVIMPGVILKEGVSVAAQSVLTKRKYRPWWLYRGNPAKALIEREGSKIIAKGRQILKETNVDYQWIKDRESLLEEVYK